MTRSMFPPNQMLFRLLGVVGRCVTFTNTSRSFHFWPPRGSLASKGKLGASATSVPFSSACTTSCLEMALWLTHTYLIFPSHLITGIHKPWKHLLGELSIHDTSAEPLLTRPNDPNVFVTPRDAVITSYRIALVLPFPCPWLCGLSSSRAYSPKTHPRTPAGAALLDRPTD